MTDSKNMSEEDFVEHCLKDMMAGWVPVAVYLRMYPDETMQAIHSRVKRGVWKRQVHYAAPAGTTPWVNLPAIRAWLEAREQ